MQMVIIIVEAAALILWMIFVKSSFSAKVLTSDKVAFIADWAYRLVINAKNILEISTGEEKKRAVLNQLEKIAEKNNISFSKTELSALIEEAYEKMMLKEDNKNVH